MHVAQPLEDSPEVSPEQELFDIFDGSVRSASETLRVTKILNREFPEVPQTYVPSGIMPSSGYPFVALGSVVGLIAFVVLRLVLSVIAVIVVAIVFGIAASMDSGFIAIAGIIMGVVLALAAFVMIYIGAGVGMAKCLSYFARLGECRSTLIPGLASIFTVGLAQIIMLIIGMAFTESSPQTNKGLQNDGAFALMFGEAMLGALIASIAAWVTTKSDNESYPYCESCLQYMANSSYNVNPQSFVQLVSVVNANDETGIVAATETMAAGNAGQLQVAKCPKCPHCFVNVLLVHTLLMQGEKGVEKTNINRVVATLATRGELIRCD